jgi:hypothetical protein
LAFALLLTSIAGSQNYSGPAASSSSAAASGSTSIADAKPLVALTGLVRVLWHTIYVEGLPVELRGVLLVAMALRNLLLVVALPLWARKAVAAQLRDWQEGISEVHACYSVQHAENIKLVHLLRVLKEVGMGGGSRQNCGCCIHAPSAPSMQASVGRWTALTEHHLQLTVTFTCTA